MRATFVTLLVASAAFAIPVTAHAIPVAAPSYDFSLVGFNTPANDTYTFSLPSTVTSTFFDPGDFYDFTVTAVVNGVSEAETVGFYSSGVGGGFTGTGLPEFLDPYGAQLFNTSGGGTITFLPGTYDLFANPNGTGFVGTISISPEPSSLMLLGTGALGLAGAFRRRLRK